MFLGKNKHEDLKKLEEFVKAPRIYGYVSHHWYGHLRQIYPVEFIDLARSNKELRLKNKYYLQETCARVNKIYGKMISYLIIPPKSDIEKHEFEFTLKKLELLLLRQIQQN